MRRRIKEMSGWEICAEVGDGREAISTAREIKPDIAILDIGMPGLEAAGKIRGTPKSLSSRCIFRSLPLEV
jgi:two-component system, NarL family, response regulator EvgA